MCRAYVRAQPFVIQPALVRAIHVAMVKVSRRGRHALGFRSTDITMTNSDPNRLVYGLAKASFNVPHGMFFRCTTR